VKNLNMSSTVSRAPLGFYFLLMRDVVVGVVVSRTLRSIL
jgi:hypothetical protein